MKALGGGEGLRGRQRKRLRGSRAVEVRAARLPPAWVAGEAGGLPLAGREAAGAGMGAEGGVFNIPG